MKHINKNIIIIIVFTLLLYYSFTNSVEISTNILDSLNIYITKVFPFLFPSIVLTNILILNNLPYYLSKYLKINSTTYIFLMSLISSTPNNAIMIYNFLKDKDIEIEEAEKVLTYTMINNPIFLYNVLILTFPPNIVLKLIVTNYLINFILFIFLRGKSKKNITIKYKKINFSNSLIIAITNSINTLIIILGTIVFFNMINFGKFSGLIEITKGLTSLQYLNIAINNKILLACIYISFGGLCIIFQIKSILKDTPIKYKYFFKVRLIHLILFMLVSHSFF